MRNCFQLRKFDKDFFQVGNDILNLRRPVARRTWNWRVVFSLLQKMVRSPKVMTVLLALMLVTILGVFVGGLIWLLLIGVPLPLVLWSMLGQPNEPDGKERQAELLSLAKRQDRRDVW